MIQRIQSIYLLIAAVLAGVLTFVFKLWSDANATPINVIDLFSAETLTEKLVPVLFYGSAIISLATIFLFKNRQLQFVLGRVNVLINLFLLGLLIYLSLTLSGETAVSEKGIGMFFPVLIILLVVLANKAIKKDEDLVKSVDRLR
ncbi:Membrane protein [Tenacibaculum sp. 190130A14a]|uniref:Membrane protein n=1 Tax=Tenacibaculum polynesiense TaxID=3137857 RepID=A0ABM9PDM5_9FLAO